MLAGLVNSMWLDMDAWLVGWINIGGKDYTSISLIGC